MERLMTMQEVQERLNVGRTTVKRLIREDPDFRTLKIGKRRMMTPPAFEAFLIAKARE